MMQEFYWEEKHTWIRHILGHLGVIFAMKLQEVCFKRKLEERFIQFSPYSAISDHEIQVWSLNALIFSY